MPFPIIEKRLLPLGFAVLIKNLSKVTYKRKLGKCGSGKELVWRAFPSSFKSLRFPNAVNAVYDLIDELINVSFQM